MTTNALSYMNSSHRQPGFTLVELLVAMAMSLFLIGGVILMYMSARAAYLDTEQLSRMQENIRFASDYVIRDLRNAGYQDEMSLTVGEGISIQSQFVRINEDGDELTIRYAGRGHCQEDFNEYRPVQNTYCLNPDTGELRCLGQLVGANGADCPSSGVGLVSGLTGIGFEVLMADDDTTASSSITCIDSPLLPLDERCLAVRVGLEFEALRDLDGAGEFDRRFVELFATFRNSALGHIYGNLYEEDDDDD